MHEAREELAEAVRRTCLLPTGYCERRVVMLRACVGSVCACVCVLSRKQHKTFVLQQALVIVL